MNYSDSHGSHDPDEYYEQRRQERMDDAKDEYKAYRVNTIVGIVGNKFEVIHVASKATVYKTDYRAAADFKCNELLNRWK